jgi:hypothetical protein
MSSNDSIVCNQCKRARSPSDFYTRNDTGRPKHPCKTCISERGRIYRVKHKEEIKARNSRWQSKNQAHVREQHRQYRTNAEGAWSQFSSHKMRGKHELTITRDQFLQWWDATPKVCDYCGCNSDQQNVVLVHLGYSARSNRLHIDRKNSSLGYSLDNICFACRICNEHKKDFFTHAQFQLIAAKFISPRITTILKAQHLPTKGSTVRGKPRPST